MADKIRPYVRPCAVKIRVQGELKRGDFNMILQLLKRTLERHERSGEVSVASSQQGVEVGPLTEETEKIPFTMVDGHLVDTVGSEWVHAHSIGGVAGKTSVEVSEMFRAGVQYDYRETISDAICGLIAALADLSAANAELGSTAKLLR